MSGDLENFKSQAAFFMTGLPLFDQLSRGTLAAIEIAAGADVQKTLLQHLPLVVLYEVRPWQLAILIFLIVLNCILFGFNLLNRRGLSIEEWLGRHSRSRRFWSNTISTLTIIGCGGWIVATLFVLHKKTSDAELAYLRSKKLDANYSRDLEKLENKHKLENSMTAEQKLIYTELLRRQDQERGSLKEEYITERDNLERKLEALVRQKQEMERKQKEQKAESEKKKTPAPCDFPCIDRE